MNRLPRNTMAKLVAATSKASPKTPPIRVRNASELPATQSVKTPLLRSSSSEQNLAASMSKKHTKTHAKRPSITSQIAKLTVKATNKPSQPRSLASSQATISPKSILKKATSCEVSVSPKKIHWGSEISLEVKAPLSSPDEQQLQQMLNLYKEELILINEIIFCANELNEKDCKELTSLLTQIINGVEALSSLYTKELKNKELKAELLCLIMNADKMKLKLCFDAEYVVLSEEIKKTSLSISEITALVQSEKINELYTMLELNVFDYNEFLKADFDFLSRRQRAKVRHMGEKLVLLIDQLLNKHKEELKAQKHKYKRLIQPKKGDGLQGNLLKREIGFSKESIKKLIALSGILKERMEVIKNKSHNE